VFIRDEVDKRLFIDSISLNSENKEHVKLFDAICNEIRATKLYQLVSQILKDNSPDSAKDLLTITIFSIPIETFAQHLPAELVEEFRQIHQIDTNSLLYKEVSFLRSNFYTMFDFVQKNK
jgi:hypothetical protein